MLIISEVVGHGVLGSEGETNRGRVAGRKGGWEKQIQSLRDVQQKMKLIGPCSLDGKIAFIFHHVIGTRRNKGARRGEETRSADAK